MSIINPVPKNYQWAIIDYYPERVSALGLIDSSKIINTMTDIRATATRLKNGHWQYMIYNSHYFGIEPSGKLAQETVEKILERFKER